MALFLISTLHDLGLPLADLGRWREALQVTEEGAALARERAATEPEDYLPDLASCLGNVGWFLLELDRPAEALEPLKEAIRILTPFHRASPEGYAQEMSDLEADYREALAAAGQTPPDS